MSPLIGLYEHNCRSQHSILRCRVFANPKGAQWSPGACNSFNGMFCSSTYNQCSSSAISVCSDTDGNSVNSQTCICGTKTCNSDNGLSIPSSTSRLPLTLHHHSYQSHLWLINQLVTSLPSNAHNVIAILGAVAGTCNT